jgi:hypothetical protein
MTKKVQQQKERRQKGTQFEASVVLSALEAWSLE